MMLKGEGIARFTHATLPSAVLSYGLVDVCVCLRLSVRSRCSIETDGRIELVLGMMTLFILCHFPRIQISIS